MAILFLILGLILLVGGGVGLFHVNVYLERSNELWFYGNLIFGIFALVGIVILIFLAWFNAEFD
jgi:hypothetical protein